MTQTPTKFTLNSDYLSIAQVSSNTYNITVGGGTLVFGGYTEQNFDFAIPSNAGASDRILISKDYGEYMLGSYMLLIPTYDSANNKIVEGFLQCYRPNASTLRAQLVLENHGDGTATYPGMTFRVKVASFKPPNVL